MILVALSQTMRSFKGTNWVLPRDLEPQGSRDISKFILLHCTLQKLLIIIIATPVSVHLL